MPETLGRAILKNLNRRKVKSKLKHGDVSSRNKNIETFVSEKETTKDLSSRCEVNTIDEYLSSVSKSYEDFVTREADEGAVVLKSKIKDNALLRELECKDEFLNEKLRKESDAIQILRRPVWTKEMSPEELAEAEENKFVEWKRDLSKKYTESNLVITPFEKNLEIWRQLWRVVEKSNLLVQIVDARNPLLFWPRDLFRYAKQVDENKETLLMMNKADFLSPAQREKWKKYFESINTNILFFSAVDSEISAEKSSEKLLENNKNIKNKYKNKNNKSVSEISSVEDLIRIFEQRAEMAEKRGSKKRFVVGMVGYPNVGKSSVINALTKRKKVAVGAVPGKTKHFQTVDIGDKIQLCDCPGLVFPTLLSSRAELLCNGIISADHSSNLLDSVDITCKRVPISQFLRVYKGIFLPVNEEYTTRKRLLDSLAALKGWFTVCKVPNVSIAARQVIKDYVTGKLLFSFPPPE